MLLNFRLKVVAHTGFCIHDVSDVWATHHAPSARDIELSIHSPH
jgi:hypothetical protein